MLTISTLSALDLAIAFIAMMIAAYEGWLFVKHRARIHLSAASISLALVVYAATMVVEYNATAVATVCLAVKVQFCALLTLTLCMLTFAEEATARRLPVPRWARRLGTVAMGSVTLFTDLVVPPRLLYLHFRLVDHPYPQPEVLPLTYALFGLCIAGSLLAGVWILRFSPNRREARILGTVVIGWISSGIHDALGAAGLIDTSIFLLEYGFLGLVFGLWTQDLRRYASLLKHTEEARQRLRAEHETLSASVSEGLMTIDHGGRIVSWNGFLARLTGVGPEQALGRPFAEVLPATPSSIADLDASMQRALKTTLARTVEIDLVVEGQQRHTRCTLVPSLTPAIGEVALIAIFVDRTERRRMVEALERSERSFRTLIEQSPLMILIEREGHVVYTNAAALRMLGYEQPAQIVGRPVLDLVHPDQRKQLSERIAGPRPVSDAILSDEQLLLRRDGQVLPVAVREMSLVFDGEPASVLLCQDLTEQRQVIARTMQNDRMVSVGMLAAGVAHEINNPLAYVDINLALSLEALRDGGFPPGDDSGSGSTGGDRAARGLSAEDADRLATLLAEAHQGARRIRDIVNELNSFSRADSATGRLALGPLIDSAINMARNEIRHRARLCTDLRAMPEVEGSQARLSQVFLNLLINAAQSIPLGRAAENEIRVRTFTEEGQAIIEVEDTGHGIAPDHLDRIFEPFFTTKPVGQGTGLGLAICRETVVGLGGEITVRSVLGQGSTFRVRLPTVESIELPSASALPVDSVSQARGRILVVDNEVIVGRSLGRLLASHEVTVTTDGREAIALLREGERYDLIFCDVMMPHMSGLEFYRALQQIDSGQAQDVIFISGGAFSEEVIRFLEEVPNLHLPKPFELSQVRTLVAERLAERAGR